MEGQQSATAVGGEAPPRRAAADRPPGRARRFSPALRRFAMPVLSLFIVLAVWQILSGTVFNRHLVPPPLTVVETAIPMLMSGEILRHIGISLIRILTGFALGTVLAVIVGVLMGRLRIVNELLDPVIEVLRYLSPTAMIPIAVIWFGIGETSKYFLIFWGTFFFVLINTIAGVMRTPVARQRAAQCLGASRLQIFALVVVPSAAPYIVTGMRVAMASSFMAIIPAEMLAADSGLGYLLQQSGLLLQTNRIFVALAAISALGFLTDWVFRWLVALTLSRYVGQAGH
jgi:NitT/TauT family transport system permease protein/taurine transport system permease protein